MGFTPRFDVVTPMTHRLQVVPRQRITAAFDGNNVVHHLANAFTFDTQRVPLDKHSAQSSPCGWLIEFVSFNALFAWLVLTLQPRPLFSLWDIRHLQFIFLFWFVILAQITVVLVAFHLRHFRFPESKVDEHMVSHRVFIDHIFFGRLGNVQPAFPFIFFWTRFAFRTIPRFCVGQSCEMFQFLFFFTFTTNLCFQIFFQLRFFCISLYEWQRRRHLWWIGWRVQSLACRSLLSTMEPFQSIARVWIRRHSYRQTIAQSCFVFSNLVSSL